MKNSQLNMTRKSTKKGEKIMKNEPVIADTAESADTVAESKCYRLTRQQFNRIKNDLIEDCDLGEMGLDDQLLMTMDKYKLLPDMYERSDRYYFMHDEMLGRVNRLLHNEMDKYDFYIEKTGKIADIIAKAKYVKADEIADTIEIADTAESTESAVIADIDSTKDSAKIVTEDSNDK